MLLARHVTRRPLILSFDWSYHGWTLGAAAATSLAGFRQILASPSTEEHRDPPGRPEELYLKAPAPFLYRPPLAEQYPDGRDSEGRLGCLIEAERLIEDVGPEKVAAIITESPLGGATVFPPEDFLPAVRALADRHGLLWIDDEVINGFGRLGEWFSYQLHPGTYPDIIAFGKGFASSALPAAGVITSTAIAEELRKWRLLQVGTFSAHPVAIAAAEANVRVIEENGILEQVRATGNYLGDRLHEMQERHPCVGHVDGVGLLWGVELVKDRETREPFVPEDRRAVFSGDLGRYPISLVAEEAAKHNVILAGWVPNTLCLGPALTVTETEIDQAMEALHEGLATVDAMI